MSSTTPAAIGAHSVIDVEVHSKSLLNATREMAITLMRTSGSPVVTEAKDFSVCILDVDVEQLAFSGWVSFHISTAVLGVEAVLERNAIEDLRPGDAFMVNDPHTSGAIHQGDVGIVMPYFIDGELVGYGYVNEHVMDIGGSAVSGFAPEARDCFSETLRFSGIRIAREGGIDPQWEEFIATNVRLPGPVLNDVRSMIAALNVGGARLEQVYRDTGAERFAQFNAVAKQLSEQAMRERIAKLPDGTYESETWVEYDARGVPEYHHLALRLVVEGDTMTFQYRGDPQVDCYINGARPSVVGQTWSTLLCQLAFDIPVNAGIRRPVEFDLGPQGTIVNSVIPAPVSMSHMETGFRINRLVNDVLAQACSLSDDPAISGRVAGDPSQSGSYQVAYGLDRRTNQPTMLYTAAMGIISPAGAQSVHDGMDTYAAQCMTGTDIPDVEIEESTGPAMILWRRLLPDSAGPGAYRGGVGCETAVGLVHSDQVGGLGVTLFPTLPARGAAGGYPGSGGTWHALRGTELLEQLERGVVPSPETVGGTRTPEPAKTASLQIRRGDVLVGRNGGGGGVGDPLQRDPALVGADVRDGYVTVTHAAAAYGVVCDEAGVVDAEATGVRRAELRERRLGSAPTTGDSAAQTTGAVQIVDGRWSCVGCGAELGAATGNWRDAAVTSERPVRERLAELGMYVREEMAGGPTPVLREHCCPSCASSLGTDVTLEGRAVVPAARKDLIDPWEKASDA